MERDNADVELAPPDSLLGLLQRGRGAGFRAALGSPAAARDLVVDCVAHDPRWDHQVEERAWYYAALVAELGIEPAELRAALASPADPSGDYAARIAVAVWELLAKRGVAGAVQELRAYLRSGRDPELALSHLLPVAHLDSEAGVLQDVLNFAGEEQLRESLWVIGDFSAEPWPRWRREEPRVCEAVSSWLGQQEEFAQRQQPFLDPAERDGAARSQLRGLGRAAPVGSALAELADLDDRNESLLFEAAPAVLADPSLRSTGAHPLIRRVLWGLRSPAALDWARQTASLDDEPGHAALALLAKLADAGDAPALRDFLVVAWSESAFVYAQCELVEALGRLRDKESTAVVEGIFDRSAYSRLRHYAAVALSRVLDDFGSRLGVECLWDCEAATRSLAVPIVEINDAAVRFRLREIADDPIEVPECRSAARSRLED